MAEDETGVPSRISTGARAVIKVPPDQAASYWRAIAETIGRLGPGDVQLEVSVLDQPPADGTASPGPSLVELEMRAPGLDQATLDDGIRQVVAARELAAPQSDRARPALDPSQPGHRDRATRADRLPPRADATVNAPISARLDQTVHAPLGRPVATQALISPPVSPPDAEPRVDPAPAVSTALARSPAQILGGHVGEIVRAVAVLLAIFIGMRSVIQTFGVDGPSMAPNFETGQRLLVNRVAYLHTDGTPFEGLLPAHRQGSVAYLFGGPHRGDVVVFRPPGASGFDSDLVKRIIGLPGETVAIMNGRVYVNGDELSEPYVQFVADYTYPGEGLAVLIPSDSYFVLGDNRPVSSDSHLGWLVPADKLVGQAWLSYWPIQRVGLVI